MDLQIVKVKKDAQSFIIHGTALMDKANSLSITKIEDTQIATLLLKDCQKTEKELEDKRIEIVQQPNDFVREVNALFKDVVVPVLTAKNTIKQKVVAYNDEQEKLRRAEEQKRLEEEQKRLQKIEDERKERERVELEKRQAEEARLADIAKAQSKERYELEQERLSLERAKREAEEERARLVEERKEMLRKQIAESEQAAVVADTKVKGILKRWTWELVDEEKVPKAFCTSDSKKINAAIKEGIRDISGIRIFEESTVR